MASKTNIRTTYPKDVANTPVETLIRNPQLPPPTTGNNSGNNGKKK